MSTVPTDMRRSFDGLAALTREVLGQDPLSGSLFIFRNRTGDRVKILAWDRSGYILWYKRLETGTFQLPEADASSVEIGATELAMLLDGLDLRDVRRRKRFTRPG